MIRRLFFIILSISVLVSCLQVDSTNPYSKDLKDLTVSLIAPEEFKNIPIEGVEVLITELNNSIEYISKCNANGVAHFTLPIGVYRVTIAANIAGDQFNASVVGIILNEAKEVDIPLTFSKTGDLLIKEIYCGGCTKYPEEGTYYYDSYITIHNNSSKVQYLDSLCFGAVDPYNSTSVTVWPEDIDFVPIIQALWMIPGDGTSHPIQPGEDAVIAVKEGIDHSATYPLSVNLNKAGYFVAYNSTQFPGSESHPVPVPGNKIQQDHILDCVIKMGQANTYTFSISSPAVVIFKTKGKNIQEFLETEGVIVQKPGTTIDRIMKVPFDFIYDGVEVFAGQSSVNRKRLRASIDASAVVLSNIYEGKSLVRKVNEERSKYAGYEVLYDTNNSVADFYESPKPLLRDE